MWSVNVPFRRSFSIIVQRFKILPSCVQRASFRSYAKRKPHHVKTPFIRHSEHGTVCYSPRLGRGVSLYLRLTPLDTITNAQCVVQLALVYTNNFVNSNDCIVRLCYLHEAVAWQVEVVYRFSYCEQPLVITWAFSESSDSACPFSCICKSAYKTSRCQIKRYHLLWYLSKACTKICECFTTSQVCYRSSCSYNIILNSLNTA